MKKILLTFIIIIFIYFIILKCITCDSYNAMSRNGSECDCLGKEITIYDNTMIDGSRFSICLGFIINRELL